MSGRRGWTVAALAMTAVALANRGGAADLSSQWRVGAEADAIVNPRLVAGVDSSDELLALEVAGAARRQTEQDDMSVTPRFDTKRYRRDPSLDVNTGQVNLLLKHVMERGSVQMDAGSGVDSTLTSELGLTGLNSINRRHFFDNAAFAWRFDQTEKLSWITSLAWSDARYSDALKFGLRNYRYSTVQAGPKFALSERGQLSLTLSGDRILPQGGIAERDYSASVQYARTVNERSGWHVAAGATRVELGGASGTRTVVDVGLNHQSERLQWDFSLQRSVSPIGLGLLAGRNQGSLVATASVGEHSSLRLSFTGIRSEPVNYYVFRIYNGAIWNQTQAEWQWRFRQRWNAAASYTHSRSQAGDRQPWAVGSVVRLALSWQGGRL